MTEAGKTDPPSGSKVDTWPSDGGSDGARLVVVAGAGVGRRHVVKAASLIGRSEEATIFFDDPKLSRRHARIDRDEAGNFYVEDLGSSNGTLLNGVPVHERAALKFGDRIQLGATLVLLFARYSPVEDQLVHRQRMELLGRIGAGIAHDFNNALAVITTGMEFLAGRPALVADDEARECLGDLEQAAHRAAELTRRVGALARAESDEGHRPLDAGKLCSEIVQLVRRTFRTAIHLESEVDDDVAVVGDAVGLHHALMNLCVNARDAMPAGGTLRLSVRRTPSERHRALGLGQKPHAEISVEDTGVGMDEATRARIFEPFFTTKKHGLGLGLGLASVRETVDLHGGRIEVASVPGKGSTFRVYLPMCAPVRDTAGKSIEQRMTVRQPSAVESAVILIADDHAGVRRGFARLLGMVGHTVLHAADGLEAIAAYDRHDPSLVLLDLDLPGLSGVEVFRRLRELDPDARVLFVSGHADAAVEVAREAPGALGVVAKPVGSEELLAAVKVALEQPPLERPTQLPE
jgi:two-component system, cell cycle sensor histidine kinase and response regulator CckA